MTQDRSAVPDLARGFRLGPWTVWPDRGVLEGPRGPVHLEPKQMDLLLCLARRASEVVGKDEIFQTVWPGQFVADVGLKRNVSQIRRALGDDAREPRIIRTIPKRGYQLLIAPVPLDQDAARPAQPLEDSRASRFATRPSVAVLPFADLSPVVGPSASRKGTAMKPAADLIEATNIPIAASSTTLQALIRRMGEANHVEHDVATGKVIAHSSLTVFSEEFTVFLKAKDSDMMSVLCDWYDCKNRFIHDTKSQGTDEILGVWLNLLGATTPALIRSSLPSRRHRRRPH